MKGCRSIIEQESKGSVASAREPLQLALGYIFLLVVILAFVYAIFRPWLAFVLIIAFPVIEQASRATFRS